MCILPDALGFFKLLFLNSVDWPFKTRLIELLTFFVTHSFIFQSLCLYSLFPPPPSSLLSPLALTCPSRLAAAVTAGQEVKAKVECHTHRVTAMPACCVRLWMESSQCQTRWRAPDAPTPAWARPFPSRGHRRGPVLPLPPRLQVTIAIVVIAAIRADDTIIFPFCVAAL